MYLMFLSEIFVDQPKSVVKDHLKYILRPSCLPIHSQTLRTLLFTHTFSDPTDPIVYSYILRPYGPYCLPIFILPVLITFPSLHEVIRRTQCEPKYKDDVNT